MVIIDFETPKKFRLINLYRVFNPQNGRTPLQNFQAQLRIITQAIAQYKSKNIIITGDFNLDDAKKLSINYPFRGMFDLLIETFDPIGLQQLISFPTWERHVLNVVKSSILDHLYVKDSTLISNISQIKTDIGDHLLITFCIEGPTCEPEVLMKRNWQNYSKELLLGELSELIFINQISSVQSM